MTKKTYRGVHGTSLTRAKSIAKTGLRPTTEGRAGAGGYLWAYVSDPEEAIQLATDWHADQVGLPAGKSPYASDPEKGLVLLFFEIELDTSEVLNINSTGHHELIRSKMRRARGRSALSKAYDDHVAGMAAAMKGQKEPVTLKVVEAMVPFPNSTKGNFDWPPLTPGGDCYIVVRDGLPQLRLAGARGAKLVDADGNSLKGM